MATTPRGMGEAVLRNLPAKNGRSLEEWLIRSEAPPLTAPWESGA